jgi:hypothetical protein
MYEVIEFTNLYENIKDSKMSLKTAYKFSRLMQQLEKEINFYQTEFAKILQSYAKKDSEGNFLISDDGDSVEIIPGKELECNTKILELRSLEVEVKDITFKLQELDDLQLTISELSCILSLIEE